MAQRSKEFEDRVKQYAKDKGMYAGYIDGTLKVHSKLPILKEAEMYVAFKGTRMPWYIRFKDIQWISKRKVINKRYGSNIWFWIVKTPYGNFKMYCDERYQFREWLKANGRRVPGWE